MYFNLYSETVISNIPLNNFGIQELESPLSSDSIELDFIPYSEDKQIKYLNHQTHLRKNYGYYYIENIALFEVFSGKKIVVNYFDEIDDDLIHTLLNYPFAILFSQRKKFVIHAASVIFNEKVFCFCGKSQSGKSSLASNLIKKGGNLISEDTCVFDNLDQDLTILPSYNFLKLSDEVNNYYNNSFLDPINFKKKSTNRKGYILDKHNFYSKPAVVDYFIYLQWSTDCSKIKKLDSENSFKMLLSNEFVSYSKDNAVNRFKSASILINQADHFVYSRKKELQNLDNFIKIFLEKFE